MILYAYIQFIIRHIEKNVNKVRQYVLNPNVQMRINAFVSYC